MPALFDLISNGLSGAMQQEIVVAEFSPNKQMLIYLA
jgi:hypothetical protein